MRNDVPLYTPRPALPADIPQIAVVNLESWHYIYRDLVPASHFRKLTQEVCELYWRKTLTAQAATVFVLEGMDGNLCGVAAAGPPITTPPANDYNRELYALYLKPSCVRQGLGTVLLGATVKQLVNDGCSNLFLWVLEKNPCRCFYEKHGAVKLASKEEDMGGFTVVKVAYGWRDLRQFLQDLT